MKILLGSSARKGVIQGSNYAPTLRKSRALNFMERKQEPSIRKSTILREFGILPYWRQGKHSKEKFPDAQVVEELQVSSLGRWIYRHQESCKWEVPSCSSNSLQERGPGKTSATGEQTPARWAPAKQVCFCLQLLLLLPIQLSECMGKRKDGRLQMCLTHMRCVILCYPTMHFPIFIWRQDFLGLQLKQEYFWDSTDCSKGEILYLRTNNKVRVGELRFFCHRKRASFAEWMKKGFCEEI